MMWKHIATCLTLACQVQGVLSSDSSELDSSDSIGCSATVLLQTHVSLQRNVSGQEEREVQVPSADLATGHQERKLHLSLVTSAKVAAGADAIAVPPDGPPGIVKYKPAKVRPPDNPTFIDTLVQSRVVAVNLLCLAIVFLFGVIYILSAPTEASAKAAAVTVAGESAGNPVAAAPAQASGGVTNVVLSLDGLRVLLIANVIANHMSIRRPALLSGEWMQHCCMFFFTSLSGFVRFMSLRKRDSYDLTAYRSYAAQILARFGPANSLALLGIALNTSHSMYNTLPLIAFPVEALFLGSAFEALPTKLAPYGAFSKAGNMVAWFTSAIVICSMMVPLLYNIRPQQKPTHILAALAVTLCVRMLMTLCVAPHGLYFMPLIRTDNHFLVRLPEVAVGMLTAQLATAMPTTFLQWPGWGWVFDGSLVLIFVLKYFGELHESAHLDKDGPQCLWPRQCMLVLMPFVAFAAYAAAQKPEKDGTPSSGILGRILACKPLSSVAKYSFGAYIYQFVCLAPGRDVVAYQMEMMTYGPRPGLAGRVFEWSPLFITFAIAVASEHLVESHVRNFVQNRIRGKA